MKKTKSFDKTTFMMVGNSPSTSRTGDTSMIIKMVVNQIAMIIFALTLQLATSASDTLTLFASIFSIGFYMVLLYTMCWEVGMTDRVKVMGGRMDYKPFRYIKVSLLANILDIALALASIIGFMLNGFSLEVNTEWAYRLYAIPNNILRILYSMYSGTLYYLGWEKIPYLLIVMIIPSIIFSELGYYIGVNGRTIRSFLGIKTAYDEMITANEIKNTDDKQN